MVSLLSSQLFWVSLIVANIISYAMYLVAYVLESRVPGKDAPIWRYQSKAYVPGDFGLSLMVAVGLYIRTSSATVEWADSRWYLGLCCVIGLLVYNFARKFLFTDKDYTWGAWRSPSKRYHDKVMFFGFCSAALYICLPAYFFTETVLTVKLIGLFGLLIWIGGNVYDAVTKETPNQYQHPSVYLPIWKTKAKK